ncbi:MAG: penicillin acylase family protein, partial [Desulfomonilia bacterium]|nr:penicillin acylase family protein [Desulfomonilia bacterium]
VADRRRGGFERRDEARGFLALEGEVGPEDLVFGLDEPLVCINSSGQSDNPASPHYDDGIEAWLAGTYQSFPFQQSNRETHYTRVLNLRPLEIEE